MNKFSLEVNNWGQWGLERDFSSLAAAKAHGVENFPQNHWRVYDRVAKSHVFHYDPGAAIEEQAAQDIGRFRDTERWRNHFIQRAAEEEAARRQRRRIAETAARQRSEQSRAGRLRGFSFVGERPNVLRQLDREREDREVFEQLAGARRLRLEYEDREEYKKVNWLKEGF